MGKWSYEVEGWNGRHIKVNGLGWASIDDMFRAHNHDVDKMESEIFRLAAKHMELQDENNRLDRDLDEARKRIAELEAPTRVPFSDAHIERMAKAAYTARMRREEKSRCWDEIPLMSKDAWRQGIRAALAAGGLEPCAVPDYDPDDVALRPTGHVLRDRLVEAEAKIENQRAELKRLNALVADLRAEVDEDNAAAASVNDLLVQVQNLTAERDALRERASVPVPEGLPTADELAKIGADAWNACAGERHLGVRDRARATAIRDAVLAGLATIDPPADQVEALARVLSRVATLDGPNDDSWLTQGDSHRLEYLRIARAAIRAVLSPETTSIRDTAAAHGFDAMPADIAQRSVDGETNYVRLNPEASHANHH